MGRQRSFCKLDVLIHYNKKLRRAPRATRDVFILALCANGDDDTGGDGIIAADDIAIDRVMDACKITDRAEAEEGIAAAFSPDVRLLERVGDDGVAIVGWHDVWGRKPGKTSAERMKAYRERQKLKAAQLEIGQTIKSGRKLLRIPKCDDGDDSDASPKVTVTDVTGEDQITDPKRIQNGESVTFRPDSSPRLISEVLDTCPPELPDHGLKLSQIEAHERVAVLTGAVRDAMNSVPRYARSDDAHINVAVEFLLLVTARHISNRAHNTEVRHLATMLISWGQTLNGLTKQSDGKLEVVRAAIKWAVADPFWGTVILGPESLAKNWERIHAKMNSPAETPSGRWETAWDLVQTQIAKVGKHRLPKWEDARVARAVRDVHWEALCDARPGDPVIRARFRKAYEEASRPVEVAS